MNTTYTKEQIESMKFDDLIKVARPLGVYKRGMTKPQMLAATLSAMNGNSSDSGSSGEAEKASDDKSTEGKKVSLSQQIRDLHAAGKTNAEITEQLGCRNKYVCDITWRVKNPSGKKK